MIQRKVHYNQWRTTTKNIYIYIYIIQRDEAKRSSLGSATFWFDVPGLRLGLNILRLGGHIPNRESILGVIGLGRWLNLFILARILRLRTPLDILPTFASPCWDFSIRRRGLDGWQLLRRKEGKNSRRGKRCWNFSDVLKKENVLSTTQLGGSRDSYPVERFCPYFGVVFPAHTCHLLCQPHLLFLHPMFVGCCLRGLKSFPSRLSCFLSFL